jgi:hypothetical protein
MTNPESFKFDMRVRERMLRRTAITDAELARHLEALRDVESQCDEMPIKQPALARHGHGEAFAARQSATPAAPRSVPPAQPPSTRDVDDEWGDGT